MTDEQMRDEIDRVLGAHPKPLFGASKPPNTCGERVIAAILERIEEEFTNAEQRGEAP